VTILPTSLADQLRGDLTAGGFNRSVQYQLQVSGTWGTATSLSAVISSDQTTQEYVEGTSEKKKVRRIMVRPLESVAFRMGDRVIYDSVTFTVEDISGTDIRRLVAVHRSSLGATRADTFKAEGAN
jgi:hypothetical protein